MRILLLSLLLALNCPAQQPQMAARATNAHALELFQYFRQMTTGNFCFSPFSSHQMASLLMSAAAGDTRAELATLAHLKDDSAKETEALEALRASLAGTVRRGSLTMEMTHSLWAANPAIFAPDFLTSSQAVFGASLQKLPAGDATACAAAVNLWVREKTRGRIPQIIGPASFPNPAHAVVAVNTLYLKGRWLNPFDLKLTKQRAFQTPERGAILLPMMQMPLGTFNYTAAESWQYLEMPMSDGEVRLLVLLPRDEVSRLKIEAGLTQERWDAIGLGLSEYDVNLMLPRFAYSTQLSLKGLWQGLGVKRLFNEDEADLSKGLPGGGYFISDVSHEAVIEVNELGAEATAATSAAADPFGDAPEQPKRRKVSFIANHPFIWVLEHKTTGLILFMGRYAGS
ncbi:MAG: serpin family protein [Prosthecobacter sp.]|uniref:serpin family protein n=1 Tax=Prosthecobacter sp. TaxID=1965333 RepID=UPI0031BBCD4B|nr:serpin family protein [Prosthecobacter sp.]